MSRLCLLAALVFAACGGGSSSSDAAPGGADAPPGSADASAPRPDAPPVGSTEVTIERSSEICNAVDGWRSTQYGETWEPGRTFVTRLEPAHTPVRVDAIEYTFQWNAGGSAPLGLAHHAWLFVGPEGAPPSSAPVASFDVARNAAVDEDEVYTIRLDVPEAQRPTLTDGQALYIAIDVTPTGAEGRSLDVDQCWVSDDPVGDFVWYAPEVTPPFTWTAEPQFFSSYVPNVRAYGVE